MKMKIMDKLSFLSASREFIITREEDLFEVSTSDSDIVAVLNPSITSTEVTYFIRGVYNNCSDYAEINIEELDKLRNFVDYLVKE